MSKNLYNVSVLGYSIYANELSDLPLNESIIINTLNGHSYTVAKKDEYFRQALKESDILLPDGISIVLGAKILGKHKIKKIAGYDLFIYLLSYLNKNHGSCFFLGAKQNTLQKIEERLNHEFPNVVMDSYSPPFKGVFSEEENNEMCERINNVKPEVLFVGMTAPKQEKWVHEHKNKLDVRIICSIGAVFDFYAGTSERPPVWLINLKLEWLGRLIKEPKRMWRRYLLSTPVFFIDVLLYLFSGNHLKNTKDKKKWD